MESMIPFEPEPLELMRERFRDALATDYRIRGDVSRPCSPGDARKQVFDFQHGLRLTVRCGEKIGTKVFHQPQNTTYWTYTWLYEW